MIDDKDLIRRGDVLAIVGPMQWSNSQIATIAASDAYKAIRALPAATPRPMGEAPRDEVVVELIETAQWARNRLEQIADDAWHGDGRDLKRSVEGVFLDFDAALAKCGSFMHPEIRRDRPPPSAQ
jgi:hypothetical protein